MTRMSSAQQDAAAHLEVLPLILQHTAVSTDIQTLCTLLQVYKGWRTVVQQSAAGRADVALVARLRAGIDGISRLSSFAAWLPQHAGLLCSIRVTADPLLKAMRTTPENNSSASATARVATQCFMLSLQSSAQAARGGRPLLQLRSYHSDFCYSPAILAALPDTLTDIDLATCDVLSDASLHLPLEGLGSLTNLHSVDLCSSRIPGHRLSEALCSLQHLTQLQVTGLDYCSGQLQLPLSLSRLSINFEPQRQDFVVGMQQGSTLELGYLTGLQQLDVSGSMPAQTIKLPAQLGELAANFQDSYSLANFNIDQLTQLLSLNLQEAHADDLSVVSKLTQLHELSFYSFHGGHLVELQRAWPQLLQLHSLEVTRGFLLPSECLKLVSDIQHLTSLTKLVFDSEPYMHGHGENAQHTSICQHLKHLTGLQELVVDDAACSIVSYDAQHLTTLINLTKLCLGSLFCDIEETTAVVLGLKLTNLEWLSLGPRYHIDWGSAALPVLGQLSSLRCLMLPRLSAADAQHGLLHLNGLTRLTELRRFEAACVAYLTSY